MFYKKLNVFPIIYVFYLQQICCFPCHASGLYVIISYFGEIVPLLAISAVRESLGMVTLYFVITFVI